MPPLLLALDPDAAALDPSSMILMGKPDGENEVGGKNVTGIVGEDLIST
jgi:hypothetical protein